MEVTAWTQLGVHTKRMYHTHLLSRSESEADSMNSLTLLTAVVLLNVLGFFDPMRALIKNAIAFGFIAVPQNGSAHNLSSTARRRSTPRLSTGVERHFLPWMAGVLLGPAILFGLYPLWMQIASPHISVYHFPQTGQIVDLYHHLSRGNYLLSLVPIHVSFSLHRHVE